jgi:hypothetical protein
MISTAKITSSMFPEIYDALLRDLRPDISRDVWQRAFVSRWACQEDYFGHILTDGGRIVGMIGLLFSERPLGGSTARFCNLHCWNVNADYRSKSLALLKPIQELKHHTFTDFTAGRPVREIVKRLGFSVLDSNAIIMFPCLPNRGCEEEIHELAGVDDPRASEMSPADRQILQDHASIDCGHLLACAESEYCYVVYSRIAVHMLPYCLVHYISNNRLFAAHHIAIRNRLLGNCAARFVVVEQRHLDGVRLPLAVRVCTNEKLYRSATVAPAEIDTLYSEMVLHKHSLHPGVRLRLREITERWLPAAFRPAIGAT